MNIVFPFFQNLKSFPQEINARSIQLFSHYYHTYYAENFTSLDFLVMDGSRCLGYVLCAALNQDLTLPDGGIIIHLFNPPPKEEKKAYLAIIDHLEKIARENGCQKIIIKDQFKEGILSPLGAILFNKKFQSRLTFEMSIDYKSFNEVDFHKNLRKSYTSLVNWGRKNLQIIYINKDFPSPEHFKMFQEFHLKIAGRKTRSEETWDTQYRIVQAGLGELIFATLDNVLVGCSLSADYGHTSIYFTGVYERTLFKFGISHFLLYEGIRRSYERKNTKNFSLGYFDTDIKDPKWYDIQFFKKGFCTEFIPTVFWSKENN